MSYLKCYNLEAQNVILFKLCHRRDKIIISDKQTLKNKAFLDGLYASENQN